MNYQPLEFSFSDQARVSILRRFEYKFSGINPYHNYKNACIIAAGEIYHTLAGSALPEDKELLEFIELQRVNRQEQLFIINNCPIDAELLPVPYESQTKNYADSENDRGKKGFVAEFTLLGANWLLRNKPIQHPLEHGGNVIHHVSPRLQTAGKAASVGAAKFGHHIENPYESGELAIDWFSLLSLRNQKTPTSFASQEQIWEIFDLAFTAQEIELIKSREGDGRFKFCSGASQNTVTELIAPIIETGTSGEFLKFRIQTEADRIFPAYPDAPDAGEVAGIIAKIKEKFAAIGSKVLLTPGRMLVIDNTRCTHGREELNLMDNDPDNLMAMRHLIRLWNHRLEGEWGFEQVKGWVR